MTLGIVNIPNNYVSDWSQGHGREWCEVAPYEPAYLSEYNPTPPQPVQVNGEWRLRYNTSSYFGKICTMPRFVLSTKDGFEVEIPVTLNAAGRVHDASSGLAESQWKRTYYWAAVLYNGEASYYGLYFKWNAQAQAGEVYCHNCGCGGFETVSNNAYMPIKPAGWWTKGDKVYTKIVCDPVLNQTRLYLKKAGGVYEHVHTRYHEVMQDTDPRIDGFGRTYFTDTPIDFRWLEPASLWLTGYKINSYEVQTPWNIDIHPIAITKYGAEKVLAGAGSYYPWSSFQNPLPSGFNSWDIHTEPSGNGGPIAYWEKEGAFEPAGMVTDSYESGDGEGSYDMHIMSGGPYVRTSPTISPGTLRFSKLRLYGRSTPRPELNSLTSQPVNWTAGTLEVTILNAATMQPIQIGGQNSISVDSNWYSGMTVALSDIPENVDVKLQFRLMGTYDTDLAFTNNGYDYTGVTPMLYGFVVTGAMPPEASPKSGKFSGSATVTLADPAGGFLIYTTDGSNPLHYIPTNDGKAVFDESGVLVLTDEPYAPDI